MSEERPAERYTGSYSITKSWQTNTLLDKRVLHDNFIVWFGSTFMYAQSVQVINYFTRWPNSVSPLCCDGCYCFTLSSGVTIKYITLMEIL